MLQLEFALCGFFIHWLVCREVLRGLALPISAEPASFFLCSLSWPPRILPCTSLRGSFPPLWPLSQCPTWAPVPWRREWLVAQATLLNLWAPSLVINKPDSSKFIWPSDTGFYQNLPLTPGFPAQASWHEPHLSDCLTVLVPLGPSLDASLFPSN